MNNLVILTGNLGKDPEKITTSTGRACTKCSIATSDNYTNQAGEKIEVTDWHKIVAWGKQADYLFERCRKGTKIIVFGKAKQSQYVKTDGTTGYDHYIQVSRFEVIAKPEQAGAWPPDPQAATEQSTDNWMDKITEGTTEAETTGDDDLPF